MDEATRTDADELAVDDRVSRAAIVAVLRASDASRFLDVAAVLVDAGVRALEITLTTPGALDALARVREQAPAGVAVGAGTVLTERDAAESIQAGAEFLVTPGLAPDVMRRGGATSTPVYPGALTPSEFMAARRLGADIVKLFPAAVMGPGYLRDLRGPLPDVRVMPTGGIRLDDVPDWFEAGATAVGLGGPLLGDSLSGGSLEALRGRADQVMRSVQAARGRR